MSQVSVSKFNTRSTLIARSAAVATLTAAALIASSVSAHAETAVGLGTTSNFAVLAG